ncbi:MAG: signal peptide peptidase SppA [Phycisphaerae bacterium]
MSITRFALTPLLAGLVALQAPARGQFEALGFGTDDAAPKIAYFKIKGRLLETPAPTAGFPLFDLEPPLSLKGLITHLKRARQDNNVKAVIVDLQNAQLGAGQLAEVHDILASFSAVDKDVFVHADTLMTGTYTLATGASQISVVPHGVVWLVGLHAEAPYLKNMLGKLGLVADIEHCGDFKSAHETFTRSGPSEQAREMTDWLLDSVYGSIIGMIADGRDMPPDKVRSIIDGGPYTAEAALEAGLIDAVQARQDFVASIKKRYGSHVEVVTDYAAEDAFKISDNPFEAFGQIMKLFNPMPKRYTDPSVAIVYVDGAIVTGEAEPNPFGGGSSGAFSTTIRKALDKAAEDTSVKAVVLRVDSPGGSALASDIIWDATQRVAQRKPVIVSMGNVAASGGYYVSCGADTIFADATTITASIGVLGGKIVTTGGWDKLGINWSTNQRGAMAAMLSTAAPFSDAERKKFVAYMNETYATFKQRVTQGRRDQLTKPIDDMAGGRVYTGAQALELGLVDKLGGLSDAIKFAAKQANLVDYDIRVIPEPPKLFDMFLPKDKEFAQIASRYASYLGHPFVRSLLPALDGIDGPRVRAVHHALMLLALVEHDGVVMMMPPTLIVP